MNTPDAEHNDVINFDRARFRRLVESWRIGRKTMDDVREAAGIVDDEVLLSILSETYDEQAVINHVTAITNHITQDEFVPCRLTNGETLTVSAPIEEWLYCPFCGLDVDFHDPKPIEEWTLEDWAEFYAGYHEGYDEEL